MTRIAGMSALGVVLLGLGLFLGSVRVGATQEPLRPEPIQPIQPLFTRFEYLTVERPLQAADLNALGAQGWELVALEPAQRYVLVSGGGGFRNRSTVQTIEPRYYFKRPAR